MRTIKILFTLCLAAVAITGCRKISDLTGQNDLIDLPCGSYVCPKELMEWEPECTDRRDPIPINENTEIHYISVYEGHEGNVPPPENTELPHENPVEPVVFNKTSGQVKNSTSYTREPFSHWHSAGSDYDPYGTVDVYLRHSSSDFVIILDAYDPVIWNIVYENASVKSKLKGVVLSGYYCHQVRNLDENVPVASYTYYGSGNYPLYVQGGDHYREDAVPFNRRAEDAVETMFGKKPATVQLNYHGMTSHVMYAEGLKSNAEVHAVNIYEPTKTKGVESDFCATTWGEVDVRVEKANEPVVLFLTSYEPTVWKISRDQGALLKGVIISGYYDQDIIGIDESVTVVQRGLYPGDEEEAFKYQDALSIDLVGSAPKTRQYKYTGSSFSVK